MTAKTTKGFIAEENLRSYFLWLGYYVLRGVKLKRGEIDLTDIDLLLFGRTSPLSRERINVDSKNKKTPQAAERIFFANGIKNTFKYDHCIVATTSNSVQISSFAEEHNITFLDGNFLKKLSVYSGKYDRISEDELIFSIKQDSVGKSVYNYANAYEISKSRLAFKIDFSTVSELLSDCRSFALSTIKDFALREPLCRCFYFCLSLFLISLDFVNKDLVVLTDSEREKRILDGFMFGSLGKNGSAAFIDKAFSVVKPFLSIDDTEIIFAKKTINDAYLSLDAKILSEFFSTTSTIKDLFKHAKEFEQLAFARQHTTPHELPPHLRSILFILLDYFKIDRTFFVNVFKHP